MPYKRQQLQSHNTIVNAGNNSKLEIISPSKANPMSGISAGEQVVTANFVQTSYSTLELSDNGIASGLTKLLISPLDSEGNDVVDFVKLLQNKKASVRLVDGGSKISIKIVKIVMPDSVTPILARVFIGG